MKEEKYYHEINTIIETLEVNAKVRVIQDNSEKLHAYWNIGRLIVECQSNEKRAKYGNELIKKWATRLSNKYGKQYSYELLRRCRKFYIYYKNVSTVSSISWSKIVEILPIKSESERNYYLNQVILNHLSVRELREEIKNKSFDRYVNRLA